MFRPGPSLRIARARLAALTGALLAAAACSANTATGPRPVVLTLTGPESIQGHDTTDSGHAAYVCSFPLVLVASGGAGEMATFDSSGYQVQVTNGPSYAGALPSGNLFAPDTAIAAGDSLAEHFRVVASGPFQFSAALYYSGPAKSYSSTAYTASCE